MPMKNSERFLQLSQEELSFLQNLLASGANRVAVSRAYYAAFYAVQALLAAIGKEPEKMKHREILRTFKENYKAQSPDLFETYQELSSERRKADREGIAKEKREIFKVLEKANKFVDEIQKLVITQSTK